MANELNIQLDPFNQAGLTLLGRVYNKSGAEQTGSPVSMSEVSSGLYSGDLTVSSFLDDSYSVRFETNTPDKLYGTGELYVRDGSEVSQEDFFNGALDTVIVATNNDKTNYSLTTADKDDIVDRNWDELYSQHIAAGSFGELMDLLRKANRAIEGEVTGTPTISSFSTNLTGYVEGTFDSELLVFVAGSINGEARPILNYSSGTFTFEEEWTQAPSSGDEFVILPQHIHPISQIQEGLDTLRNVKPSIPI